MNGEIIVKSTIGKGTEFRVEIPYLLKKNAQSSISKHAS
jgi:hypothetical protein